MKNLIGRLETTNKRLQESQWKLESIRVKRGWGVDYFSEQWTRQKALQMDAISKTRQRYLQELGELLDLEERLVDAQYVDFHLINLISSFLVSKGPSLQL